MVCCIRISIQQTGQEDLLFGFLRGCQFGGLLLGLDDGQGGSSGGLAMDIAT
jgi:hypothetical protein